MSRDDATVLNLNASKRYCNGDWGANILQVWFGLFSVARLKTLQADKDELMACWQATKGKHVWQEWAVQWKAQALIMGDIRVKPFSDSFHIQTYF